MKQQFSFFDYDPITGKKIKDDKAEIRAALTPAKKRAIMDVVGNKCEMKGCRNKAHHVHHIKQVAKGGTNVGSNLVVLCANCHNDVSKITQTQMNEIVKNRSEKKRTQINAILRNRKKAGAEKGESEPKWLL
jgi:5-methylcytosine-specific restriction endonuclease McrA